MLTLTLLLVWPRWCGSTPSMSRCTICSVIRRPMSSRALTRQPNSKSWRMSNGGFVTSSPSYQCCGSWLEKETESRRLLTPRSACSLEKVGSPDIALARSVAGVLAAGETCFCPGQPCCLWNSDGAVLMQAMKLASLVSGGSGEGTVCVQTQER